jgi:hypothetical protein
VFAGSSDVVNDGHFAWGANRCDLVPHDNLSATMANGGSIIDTKA